MTINASYKVSDLLGLAPEVKNQHRNKDQKGEHSVVRFLHNRNRGLGIGKTSLTTGMTSYNRFDLSQRAGFPTIGLTSHNGHDTSSVKNRGVRLITAKLTSVVLGRGLE